MVGFVVADHFGWAKVRDTRNGSHASRDYFGAIQSTTKKREAHTTPIAILSVSLPSAIELTIFSLPSADGHNYLVKNHDRPAGPKDQSRQNLPSTRTTTNKRGRTHTGRAGRTVVGSPQARKEKQGREKASGGSFLRAPKTKMPTNSSTQQQHNSSSAA